MTDATDKKPADDSLAPPPAKKHASTTDDEKPVVTAAAGAPVGDMAVVGMTSKPDSNVIYPNQYDTFDEGTMLLGDMVECKKGAGGWMSYITINGNSGVHRLHVQTPVVSTPNGIRQSGDMSPSLMLSMGNNYQGSPTAMSFCNLLERVQNAIAKIILEKGWAKVPGKPEPTMELVKGMISPMLSEGVNPKTNLKYPATMFPSITLVQKSPMVPPAVFLKPAGGEDPNLVIPAAAADVVPRSLLVCVLQIPFIYKKIAKGAVSFTIHVDAIQVCIEPSSETGSLGPCISRTF